MATPRTVVLLTAPQRAELARVRDTDPRPYVRERAAAILKVAAGQAVYQVAQTGLFRWRCPETVADWIARFFPLSTSAPPAPPLTCKAS